jgi:hypothetical protein
MDGHDIDDLSSISSLAPIFLIFVVLMWIKLSTFVCYWFLLFSLVFLQYSGACCPHVLEHQSFGLSPTCGSLRYQATEPVPIQIQGEEERLERRRFGRWNIEEEQDNWDLRIKFGSAMMSVLHLHFKLFLIHCSQDIPVVLLGFICTGNNGSASGSFCIRKFGRWNY